MRRAKVGARGPFPPVCPEHKYTEKGVGISKALTVGVISSLRDVPHLKSDIMKPGVRGGEVGGTAVTLKGKLRVRSEVY